MAAFSRLVRPSPGTIEVIRPAGGHDRERPIPLPSVLEVDTGDGFVLWSAAYSACRTYFVSTNPHRDETSLAAPSRAGYPKLAV